MPMRRRTIPLTDTHAHVLLMAIGLWSFNFGFREHELQHIRIYSTQKGGDIFKHSTGGYHASSRSRWRALQHLHSMLLDKSYKVTEQHLDGESHCRVYQGAVWRACTIRKGLETSGLKTALAALGSGGAEEVMRHPWFSKVNWVNMQTRILGLFVLLLHRMRSRPILLLMPHQFPSHRIRMNSVTNTWSSNPLPSNQAVGRSSLHPLLETLFFFFCFRRLRNPGKSVHSQELDASVSDQKDMRPRSLCQCSTLLANAVSCGFYYETQRSLNRRLCDIPNKLLCNSLIEILQRYQADITGELE